MHVFPDEVKIAIVWPANSGRKTFQSSLLGWCLNIHCTMKHQRRFTSSPWMLNLPTVSQIYSHWNWNSKLNTKLRLEFQVEYGFKLEFQVEPLQIIFRRGIPHHRSRWKMPKSQYMWKVHIISTFFPESEGNIFNEIIYVEMTLLSGENGCSLWSHILGPRFKTTIPSMFWWPR